MGEAEAQRSAAAGSGGPAGLPHALGGVTFDTKPDAVRFAEGHGYSVVRYHFEMRRPLDVPIELAPMPESLEIRPVLPEHHRPVWDADEEAFRDHWDSSVVTEDDYLQFVNDPDFNPSLWLVAWYGDEIAGSVINGIYPHEIERTGQRLGWLDSVSTRRAWRGRGLASALITRSLALHREHGMEFAALGVDAKNPTGALQLYERFGFRRFRTLNFYRKPFPTSGVQA